MDRMMRIIAAGIASSAAFVSKARYVALMAVVFATSSALHADELDASGWLISYTHTPNNLAGDSSKASTTNGYSSGYGVGHAFDNVWTGGNGTDRWLATMPSGVTVVADYDFGSGNEKVVNALRFLNQGWDGANRSPKAFTVYGSNDGGTTWTELGGETSISDWTANQWRSFVFNNSTAYAKYRFAFTKLQGASATVLGMAEIGLMKIEFTATATTDGDVTLDKTSQSIAAAIDINKGTNFTFTATLGATAVAEGGMIGWLGDVSDATYSDDGCTIYLPVTANRSVVATVLYPGTLTYTPGDATTADWTTDSVWQNEDGAMTNWVNGSTAVFPEGVTGSITLSSDIFAKTITFANSGDFQVNGTGAIVGTNEIVKTGTGTLDWNLTGGLDRQPIRLQNGVFRLGDDLTYTKGASDLGASTNTSPIIIESGASIDINFNSTAGTVSREGLLYDKLIYMEGSGYKDMGALFNTNNLTWYTIKDVVLTGDATVGGSERFTLRGDGISNYERPSAKFEGGDYALAVSGEDAQFFIVSMNPHLKQFVITNEAKGAFGYTTASNIEEVVLSNGNLQLDGGMDNFIPPVTVTADSTLNASASAGAALKGKVTINEGVALTQNSTSSGNTSYYGDVDGDLRIANGKTMLYAGEGSVVLDNGGSPNWFQTNYVGNVTVMTNAFFGVGRDYGLIDGKITLMQGATLYRTKDVTRTNDWDVVVAGTNVTIQGSFKFEGGSLKFVGVPGEFVTADFTRVWTLTNAIDDMFTDIGSIEIDFASQPTESQINVSYAHGLTAATAQARTKVTVNGGPSFYIGTVEDGGFILRRTGFILIVR